MLVESEPEHFAATVGRRTSSPPDRLADLPIKHSILTHFIEL